MFNQDPTGIYQTSPAAIHNHKRNRQLSVVCYALMAIIGVMGLWTILRIIGVFGDSLPDLIDVGSIGDHILARLVPALALVTLALYMFKEWKYGDFAFSMVYFLVPLLALWLFPVIATELEPDELQVDMSLRYYLCEPGGVEGNVVLDSSLCEPVAAEDQQALISNADPTRDDAETMTAGSRAENVTRWNLTGRGDYMVYFMLEQDSLDVCENSQIVSQRPTNEDRGYSCLERDGAAWSVHPYIVRGDRSGLLEIYQQLP